MKGEGWHPHPVNGEEWEAILEKKKVKESLCAYNAPTWKGECILLIAERKGVEWHRGEKKRMGRVFA